jgi:hypothetical protein
MLTIRRHRQFPLSCERIENRVVLSAAAAGGSLLGRNAFARRNTDRSPPWRPRYSLPMQLERKPTWRRTGPCGCQPCLRILRNPNREVP